MFNPQSNQPRKLLWVRGEATQKGVHLNRRIQSKTSRGHIATKWPQPPLGSQRTAPCSLAFALNLSLSLFCVAWLVERSASVYSLSPASQRGSALQSESFLCPYGSTCSWALSMVSPSPSFRKQNGNFLPPLCPCILRLNTASQR